MELLKSIISFIHVLTATLSMLFGFLVLVKRKGTAQHKRIGLYYFWTMIINNITALFIYKVSGSMFFPHYLAIACLVLLIPGFLIVRFKNVKYWLLIHLFCFVLSYYLLIGGAVNEAFLRIPTLKPYIINQSPEFGLTHFVVMLFFIFLLLYFIIINRKLKSPKK